MPRYSSALIGSLLFVPIVASCNAKPQSMVVPDSSTIDASAEKLRLKIVQECNTDAEKQNCLEKAVVNSVTEDGPEIVTKALSSLIDRGDVVQAKDYHDLSHRIGRATAKALGVNPEAFLRCPTDFNYGCPHGFFEQALVTEQDAKAAALRICDEQFFQTKAAKSLFYCFHGVGHGLMMANGYDLDQSLNDCDVFGGSKADGCWQGVFMENVNGVMGNQGGRSVFSDDDLLAPCNAIADKYRWECYINHAGYLIPKSDHSTEKATAECVRETNQNGRRACLESIGLMATNPTWQRSLVKKDLGSLERNAASICARFPAGHRQSCFRAGVDNLLNFDGANATRAAAFCMELPESDRADCVTRIGQVITHEIPVGTATAALCDPIPDSYRSRCLQALPL